MAAAAGKKKPTVRRSPRVTTDGDTKASSVRELVNKVQNPATAGVPIGSNGMPMIELISQSSETVPVAQYANVVVGPIAIRRWIEDPGLHLLVGVDADDYDKRQQAIYDAVADAIELGQEIVEAIVSEDRQLVQESVAEHNRRAQEEEKAKGKGK